MMGRLVRMVRGEWEMSLLGEWEFKIDPSNTSYGIMVQETEKLNTLVEMVKSRYNINDVICLTYQFPFCMLEPQGKRSLPIEMNEDGDVELFMAVRVQHIGLPLYVTVGIPALERYRFNRRSAIDMSGLPHIFGESSLSLGLHQGRIQPNQQRPGNVELKIGRNRGIIDPGPYYWNSLIATGTVPLSLAALDDILNNQERVPPMDVEERTGPLLRADEDDRSSTGSSEEPLLGSPFTPERCGSSIHKWVEEDSLLGTTIANLSLMPANIGLAPSSQPQEFQLQSTEAIIHGRVDKGKAILTSEYIAGESSTQLTLGRNETTNNDFGFDYNLYTQLHQGDYRGLENVGFIPASIKAMEEIFNNQEMELFKDAGVLMMGNVGEHKTGGGHNSSPMFDDTQIPESVGGIIRLGDNEDINMADAALKGDPPTRGVGEDSGKTTKDPPPQQPFGRPVRKNLDNDFDMVEDQFDERELRKLGFFPASLEVLKEIFTDEQIDMLKKKESDTTDKLRAEKTGNEGEQMHAEKPVTMATIHENVEIGLEKDASPSDAAAAEISTTSMDDSEGIVEIQARSEPVYESETPLPKKVNNAINVLYGIVNWCCSCWKPKEMECGESSGAMTEPADACYGGTLKMEGDDSESEEETYSGPVKNNPQEIYVGMMFRNRDAFKQHMALYALANKFRFHNKKSNPRQMVLECVGRACPWRVYAIKMSDSDWYQVRRLRENHMCTVNERVNFQRHATTDVIGDMMRTRFSGQTSGPRPRAVREIMRDSHNVPISYYKAWRAREVAMDNAKGSTGESFKRLPMYLHTLVLANPGSVAHVDTEYIENVGSRFKYLFLAFGASIAGFQFMRKVIIIDGTFLKSKYAGCLLTASGQDGNYQIYPLAFAVVDSENERSYVWFFQKLQEIVPDSENLVFISDRHNAILASLSKVYPKANHCSCIVHLQRNVVSIFKKKHLSYLVSRAGRAYRLHDFVEHFNEIISIDPECARYLQNVGLQNWTRSHSFGNRYNLMTSNIAESLNAALSEARDYPIIPLIEFIRATMMGWFHVRRAASNQTTDGLTPRIHKMVAKKFEMCTGFDVKNINCSEYEVRTKEGVGFHVDLQMKTCSCSEFQMLSIPCTHAIAAAIKASVGIDSLVAKEFGTEYWRRSYEGSIYPVQENNEENLPGADMASVELLPPLTRRPPGRPRKRRFLSRGEIKGEFQRKLKVCSRCRGVGHNRATCKVPI